MSRTRQHQQSEAVRERILQAARRVIAEEGVAALSIRRITKEIDYSAGIVYHYFDSKEHLLQCALAECYGRILEAVGPPDSGLAPDAAIRAAFTRYIQSALQWPEEYKAFMLSASPDVLSFTSVLGEGDPARRPALASLVAMLASGIEAGLFAPCDPALTAQALWSATFGLTIRLLTERDISPEQRERLIGRQIELMMGGLAQ